VVDRRRLRKAHAHVEAAAPGVEIEGPLPGLRDVERRDEDGAAGRERDDGQREAAPPIERRAEREEKGAREPPDAGERAIEASAPNFLSPRSPPSAR